MREKLCSPSFASAAMKLNKAGSVHGAEGKMLP